jgi:hypothetical protein
MHRGTLYLLGYAFVLLAASNMAGCKGCHRGTPVPFKRGETGTPEVTAAPGDRSPVTATTPEIGTTYPDGTSEIKLADSVLKVAAGRISASLSVDLDQDHDRDGLLAVVAPEGPVLLQYAERTEVGLSELRDVTAILPARSDRRVGHSEIRTLGNSLILVSIDLVSDTPPPAPDIQGAAGQPPSPNAIKGAPSASPASAESPASGGKPSDESIKESHFWVVSRERQPRVLEHFAVLPATENRAAGEFNLTFSGDTLAPGQSAGIVTQIAYRPVASGATINIDLQWLNWPTGLARDPIQPEKSFEELATRSGKLLATDPDQALRLADQVLSLHGALCRETGATRLVVGDSHGITCGSSAATGKAAANKTVALAKRGQLFAALDSYAAQETPSYRVLETDRVAALEAIYALATVSETTWQQGPIHQLPPGRGVRLSAIAFLDDNSLLLRGAAPLRYDLTDHSYQPVDPALGNTEIRDPSERFAIDDIYRACEGYKLRIVSSAKSSAAKTKGQEVVSEPLIEPRPAPPSSNCPEPMVSASGDRGGFSVLGWGGKGILLAKAGRLWLLPLDTEAHALSELVAIAPGRPVPGPIQIGAITSDGRAFALLTIAGVVLRAIGGTPYQKVFRPSLWDYSRASDPAVSPSGKKIALLYGGRILIGTITSNP